MINNHTITIKETQNETVLASAAKVAARFFEGSWYFDWEAVDMNHLLVTDRIYICPYKGRCYWIDLQTAELKAQNVAWTYFEVKPGYEFIKDKIGFYSGRRAATFEEQQ
jgi:uncharacterized protein (DUF427 family)